MNDVHKFGAYLFIVIGLSLCAMEPKPPEPKAVVVRPAEQFNRKIYRDRAAYEKDKALFVKTVCDSEFNGGTVGGRGYECV